MAHNERPPTYEELSHDYNLLQNKLERAANIGEKLLTEKRNIEEQFIYLKNYCESQEEELQQTRHELQNKIRQIEVQGLIPTSDSQSVTISESGQSSNTLFNNLPMMATKTKMKVSGANKNKIIHANSSNMNNNRLPINQTDPDLLSQKMRAHITKENFENLQTEINELKEANEALEKEKDSIAIKLKTVTTDYLALKSIGDKQNKELVEAIQEKETEEDKRCEEMETLIEELLESKKIEEELKQKNRDLECSLEEQLRFQDNMKKDINDAEDNYQQAAGELQKANVELRELRIEIAKLRKMRSVGGDGDNLGEFA